MPVETYKEIPQIAQTIVWDGTNSDEVIAFMGDDFIGQGEFGIDFKLKQPNHYGNDSLLLVVGSRFTRFSDGNVSNYPYTFEDASKWELIKQD